MRDKQDSRLYTNLPPQRQEEVERLLQEGSGRGWRHLGAALGYEPEQLDLFERGEAPAHTLLSNWAQKEGSTLGLLCSAVARIERPDIVTALNCPVQGVSVVWQLLDPTCEIQRLRWKTLTWWEVLWYHHLCHWWVFNLFFFFFYLLNLYSSLCHHLIVHCSNCMTDSPVNVSYQHISRTLTV